MKSSLVGDLHSVGGSISVPAELLVSARAANAAIEKNVWEMQSVVRSFDANIESVYSTTFDPGKCDFGLDCGDRGTCGRQISVRCFRREDSV